MSGAEVEVFKVAAEYVVTRYALDPLVDRAGQRLRRFGAAVTRKLRGRPLRAPDRVVVKVLEEVSLTDDPIVADYLAGVLAATGPDDDAGAAVAAQIGRLSAFQLRLHYVAYREVWRHERERPGSTVDLRDVDDLAHNLETFVPAGEAYAALGLAAGEPESAVRVLSALPVLAREGLVAGLGLSGRTYGPSPAGFAFAGPDRLGSLHKRVFPGPGLSFRPTPSGIELFSWGCGWEDHDPVGLRTLPAELVEFDPSVPPCPGAVVVSALPRTE